MKVSMTSKHGLREVSINRRRAIHERCLNCVSWHPKELISCKLDDCPLHSFRSGKGKQDSKARRKAIRAYCLECMNGRKSEVRKCPSLGCSLFIYRNGGLARSQNTPYFRKNSHIGTEFEEIRLGIGIVPTLEPFISKSGPIC
jgi:hypothetical protein